MTKKEQKIFWETYLKEEMDRIKEEKKQKEREGK